MISLCNYNIKTLQGVNYSMCFLLVLDEKKIRKGKPIGLPYRGGKMKFVEAVNLIEKKYGIRINKRSVLK